MLLPERVAHMTLSCLWILALLPLYISSGSVIASTALLVTVLTAAIFWPTIWSAALRSKNDFVSYWVSEYKFYEFAMKSKAMASRLKTEKKQRKVSP